ILAIPYHGQPVAAFANAFHSDSITGPDPVMLVKTSYRFASSEDAARLAGLGIRREIGLDDLVHSVQFNLNQTVACPGRFARRCDAVRREEIVVAPDVQVTLAQVAICHD